MSIPKPYLPQLTDRATEAQQLELRMKADLRDAGPRAREFIQSDQFRWITNCIMDTRREVPAFVARMSDDEIAQLELLANRDADGIHEAARLIRDALRMREPTDPRREMPFTTRENP